MIAVPDTALSRDPEPRSRIAESRCCSAPENYRSGDAIQDNLKLLRDYASNSPQYPRVHDYFRASKVPLLAVWGRGDEIFGPAGAQAFADDLPDAEIHLLEGGHFLLESALDEVTGLIRSFLAKVLPAA